MTKMARAISQNSRYQLMAAAKPAFFLVYALSIIFIPGRTLAFAPDLSPITQSRCITQKSLMASSYTTSIHYVHTQLSMVAKSGGKPISSEEQFEREVLTDSPKNKLTLVLYTAPWCGPCRLTNPVVKEIMKQYQSKLEVAEINTDDLPEVASNAGVTSIPTIQIYHQGKVKDTIVGCVSKNVLGKAVDKVLEDMGMLGGDDDTTGEDGSEGVNL
jgi:thioredoxin 1